MHDDTIHPQHGGRHDSTQPSRMVCAESLGSATQLPRGYLPRTLLEQATSRLALVSLGVAALAAISLVQDLVVTRVGSGWLAGLQTCPYTNASMFVLSIGVFLLTRSPRISPRVILGVGLVYRPGEGIGGDLVATGIGFESRQTGPGIGSRRVDLGRAFGTRMGRVRLVVLDEMECQLEMLARACAGILAIAPLAVGLAKGLGFVERLMQASELQLVRRIESFDGGSRPIRLECFACSLAVLV